jgi:hypothetical protein
VAVRLDRAERRLDQLPAALVVEWDVDSASWVREQRRVDERRVG